MENKETTVTPAMQKEMHAMYLDGRSLHFIATWFSKMYPLCGTFTKEQIGALIDPTPIEDR